jgi:hypothetical protein
MAMIPKVTFLGEEGEVYTIIAGKKEFNFRANVPKGVPVQVAIAALKKIVRGKHLFSAHNMPTLVGKQSDDRTSMEGHAGSYPSPKIREMNKKLNNGVSKGISKVIEKETEDGVDTMKTLAGSNDVLVEKAATRCIVEVIPPNIIVHGEEQKASRRHERAISWKR